MVTCEKQALENDLLNRNMSCQKVTVSFVVETEKLVYSICLAGIASFNVTYFNSIQINLI
jgi:hypothetical protein